MSSHTFALPEIRCVHLLVKNLGMPESDVRKELGALGIHAQQITHLQSRYRDQDTEKDRPPKRIF